MPSSALWSQWHWALAFASATSSCYSAPSASAPGSNDANEHALARPDIVGEAGSPPETSSAGAAGTTGIAGATGTATGCEPNSFVLTSELSNARDLGGTPLSPAGAVACGAIYRGPPLRLSDSGCGEAAQLGIRTLIDLRIESERTNIPDAACVDAKRVFAPLPVPYLNDLHETASMAVAFHTFGDEDAYPIYFHCTFGRDRTGVVGALLLLALGATRETVMQEYLLSQPYVGAFPDSLAAVLDEVEQRGGAEAVLSELGITTAELEVMRAHAVAIE
jgi:hypothetical protein